MLISGLELVPDYIAPSGQTQFLAIIDNSLWMTDLKRRVQHYGYRYDYKARKVDSTMYLGTLPDWAHQLAIRLHLDGYIAKVPDQLIANEYVSGQGIAPHVDCVPCFDDTILSITLGSACIMDFTKLKSTEKQSLYLTSGSLLIMKDEARYDWKHGISARKSDVIDGERITRGRRVSLTFRCVTLE